MMERWDTDCKQMFCMENTHLEDKEWDGRIIIRKILRKLNSEDEKCVWKWHRIMSNFRALVTERQNGTPSWQWTDLTVNTLSVTLCYPARDLRNTSIALPLILSLLKYCSNEEKLQIAIIRVCWQNVTDHTKYMITKETSIQQQLRL
jgi:hypothetical protein